MSIRHHTYINSKGKKVVRHTSSYKDVLGQRHTVSYTETEDQINARREKSNKQWLNVLCGILFAIAVCMGVISIAISKINITVILLMTAFAAPLIVRIVLKFKK